MAWSTPTSRSAGYVVPHTEWNQNTVDNPVALRAGGIAIASQAANELIIASSSTQLSRVAPPSRGAVLYAGASGLPSWLAAGTINYILTAQGAGADPAWVAPSGVTILDRDVSANTVVSSASETTVYTFTVPGGTLSTNRGLRLTMLGVRTDSVAGTTTIRVKFGSTTVATHALASSASTADILRLRCELVAKNATNAQIAYCETQIGQGGSSDNGDGQSIGAAAAFMRVGIHNGVAEDSTADKALAITFQHSASDAGLSATCGVVWLEWF